MEWLVRGNQVAVEEHGAGRPIVFLHGSPTDHRSLTFTYEPILEHRVGWQRIYPDLPGHGDTPRSASIGSHDDMVAWTIEFLETVADTTAGTESAATVGRLVLLGESYGGYLALRVVEQRPDLVDGLGLVVPVTDLDPAQGARPARRVLVEADPALRADIGPGEEMWLEVSAVQTRANLDAMRQRILPGAQVADMEFLQGLYAKPSAPARPPAQPFAHPTLVVTGRHDHIVGYARVLGMLESFPRATCAVLDGAGHAVSIEQAEVLRVLVKDWLDRLDARA